MVAPKEINLQNKDDVIRLLGLVRNSGLDPAHKDEIRDLVFAFNQKPEQSVLQSLKEATVAIGVKIQSGLMGDGANQVPIKKVAADSVDVGKKQSFGRPRPQPAFGSFTQQLIVSDSESVEKQPVEEVVAVEAEADFVPASIHAQEINEDDGKGAVKEVETEVKPEPEVEESVPTTSEETPPITKPETSNAISKDEATARIKEIKREINRSVGNPVKLIDLNKEIGREYMSSLLSAMKSTSSGQGLYEAMDKLETVFHTVQELMAVEEDDTAPESVVASSDVTPTPTEKEAPAESASVEKVAAGEDVLEENLVSKEEPQEPQSEPVIKPKSPELQSVAIDAQKQEQDRVRRALDEKERQEASPADPLHTPEVDAGLKQLLSEWNIFKSSGMFGTGPSGFDHPLFTELRHLHMNVVLAGRFDGVTPYVKQSIHDYMNGWRYEQGMTHEMQETFEHYLRRVIKTIIEKQHKDEVSE